MRVLRRCVTAGLALGAVTLIAACGSSSNSSSSASSSGGGGVATSSSTHANATPITIGTSLSLSGDFAADGQAFQRGYQLWAADQNKAGGLMGHPIKLDVLSDASSPAQVVSNYQKLIGSNKDQLVFGPFSSLLTVPAARIAQRYGYAFVEGAGGAPHDDVDLDVGVVPAGRHDAFDHQRRRLGQVDDDQIGFERRQAFHQ